MKRGPKNGAFKPGVSVANMQAAWGEGAPEWLVILAEECNRHSQGKIAQRLGYSAPVISQVLKNKYRGDLRAVEKAVRGALLSETLDCPGIDDPIETHQCLDWQKRARRLSTASPLSVAMYRACRGDCPHSRIGEKSRAE